MNIPKPLTYTAHYCLSPKRYGCSSKPMVLSFEQALGVHRGAALDPCQPVWLVLTPSGGDPGKTPIRRWVAKRNLDMPSWMPSNTRRSSWGSARCHTSAWLSDSTEVPKDLQGVQRLGMTCSHLLMWRYHWSYRGPLVWRGMFSNLSHEEAPKPLQSSWKTQEMSFGTVDLRNGSCQP